MQHLKENIIDETLLLITADHACYYPESPRKKTVTMGERHHYEDIDIPLMLLHKHHHNVQRNICDSMGVTATLLDILKVPLNSSYKGQSIFNKGKEYVISENAGQGNADLKRKDLYFAITTNTHKLMLQLNDAGLKIIKFYNILIDPKETKNLINEKYYNFNKGIIKNLITNVYKERKRIFEIRGINNLKECFKAFK